MRVSSIKKYQYLLSIIILLISVSPVWSDANQIPELEEGFVSPPDACRPWVYWFIMDGNLNREGITADFEAMKQAGIGGMVLMEVSVGIPRGPVEFMSDAWRALFKHAVEEAERLGLEITLNAGPGWTGSGGPWVKPEQSMQHLVACEVNVAGPSRFQSVLPLPKPRKPYFGEAGLPPEMLQARDAFYADEVVLAIPQTSSDYRIEEIDEKALYVREPFTSKPNVKPYLPALASYQTIPHNAVIDPKDIIDLTDRLQSDGSLTWDAPAGNWTILRFGRRNTGANTRPAPQPGLGLESDKFDPIALDAHFNEFIGALLDTVGPRPIDRTSGWTMLHIDSWEMGSQNWTAGFRQEFIDRRGYNPLLYLPVFTGRVIESLEISERFLWDLRLTAQELVLENHAQHLKELGHANGFGLSIEPYDMNPTSDMALGGIADTPMCEFWSHGYDFDSTFSCFEAVSVAHTMNRKIVAAESFTAGSKEAWKLFPAVMKNQGDWALCTGINRIVFHRFAHQPWLNRRPGMTMGPYGVHWDRTQTWWPMASAYHGYLARCQFVLRQGSPVADICYLIPEGAPHVFSPPSSAVEGELQDRRGYNFDGCEPMALINNATVRDGRIFFPGGAAYRMLVLPAFDTMTPALLTKIKCLVEAGATVVGSPPCKSPSLSNYPQCDQDIQLTANELWGANKQTTKITKRQVGAGVIYCGGKLDDSSPDKQDTSQINQARWIWSNEGNPDISVPPSTRYFRRVFSIDANKRIESARIEITADNEFQLWINGATAIRGDNFNHVYRLDVETLLQPGNNILAVEAANGGDNSNPAGLIAALHIQCREGDETTLVTNKQWQTCLKAQDDWHTLQSDNNQWTNAKELGPADMNPWRLNASQDELPELYPEYEVTASLLSKMELPPDFEADAPIRYTHRRAGSKDIYFVANRTANQVKATCRFRVTDKQPELWNPLNGDIRSLPEFTQDNGRITIPLIFEAHQSFFIIFDNNKSNLINDKTKSNNFPTITQIARIDGPWDMSFAEESGGPGNVIFQTLDNWSKRPEKGIKYYSGIAVYKTSFDLPQKLVLGQNRLSLDLGIVHNLAQIYLNGKDMGILWCNPWQVDITNNVQDKDNRLEIHISNLWPNRLIGDMNIPVDQRIAWTTWNPYKKDDALLPSGLLGPVTLNFISE